MAVDEALLESATNPAIRFYGWARPAVSFGYFGKFDEAERAAEGRELVRRWTGGGIVLHGADLTYSIVIPATDHYFVRSPLDLYSDVHAALRIILIQDGLKAVLASSSSQKISGACFANSVRADVMIDGKKIAGAAQRRTRRGLLQQGSIQYDELSAEVAERFAQALCPRAEAKSINEILTRRAQNIAEQKYALESWLRRR